MEKLTRRGILGRALVGGLTVTAASLLAACGGASEPSSSGTSGTGAAPATAAAPQASAATPIPAAQPSSNQVIPASKPEATPGSTAATTPSEAGAPSPDLVVKPPKAPSPVTLRFHMRSGGEKAEPSIYVYRPQEWEEGTGNKIKLEPIPGGKDYIPKIDSLAASGTIGDLTWTSDVYSEHSHLVRFKVLQEVDSFMKTYKIPKDEWFPAITDTLTYDGVMYGLPKTGHPADSYIFINLKMFKDAGIPEPPTYGVTFDQISEWANKLSKGSKDSREVYGFYSGIKGIMPITNGVRQFGGDLVAKDGLTSLVDKPEFSDWLNWNHKLVVEDKVHPFSQAIPNNDLTAVFAAEKVAMMHVQRASYFQTRNAVKDKFEWTEIQYPRGSKAIGWLSAIDTHSATAASKYRDEAFSLIYALADKRFAFLVGKFQGYLTGRKDNLDDLGPYAQDHFIQLQQKCTEQEAQLWRAKNLRAYEFETALNNALDLVWLGKSQPDKGFINDLKKSLDEVLAKPE